MFFLHQAWEGSPDISILVFRWKSSREGTDYADAHCDLASASHAMGDDERVIKVFQKVVDLKLGAGEKEEAKKEEAKKEEAKKDLKEALKMTNRVELHDTVSHLKPLQKKKKKSNGVIPGESPFAIVEPTKFKIVGEKSVARQ
ncbi:hypothetical protein TSUD_18180 [Trifolium subterraneum]|uniref:Uncharacterized protein n=1 Tax=Trifolium subterraneum TaxID=3900 RepID=A0A2Z6P9Y4_TRISU|nr:hypothetical protein TSUD_18180 [Trifolium subterraneum]